MGKYLPSGKRSVALKSSLPDNVTTELTRQAINSGAAADCDGAVSGGAPEGSGA